jgi:TonB family protein
MKVRYMDFAPTRATLKVTEVGENETPSGNDVKPVEVGDLNAKAVTMPKPVLTDEAKRVKASGKVSVRVVVDENGKVVSATALNNVALLRQLAEDAARQAVFNPLTVGGITVRFTGTLTYDFH